MINAVELRIWGRDFNLPVEYDCYRGEEITEAQEKAIGGFKNKQELIDKTQKKVEEYCKAKVLEDDENEKKDNIFSYIKPEYLFIKREENPRILMMCKYRYDLERGVAVAFSSDGSIAVGPQDMILK